MSTSDNNLEQKAIELERVSRRWCQLDGFDPDWQVVDDRASFPIASTPFGKMKMVLQVVPMPLWQVYAKGIVGFEESGVVVSIKEEDRT